MLLTLELPVFPHAVLYQQSLSAAAVVAQAAAATGGGASIAAGAAGSAAGVADVIRFQDPEVSCIQQCSPPEPLFGNFCFIFLFILIEQPCHKPSISTQAGTFPVTSKCR